MAELYGLSKDEAKPDHGAAAALVKDTTTANFGADVVAESARQPVLVDFWAPWCGPCKQLTPILEKLVQAAGGKVKLVKMNIEEHPEIAGRLGVRSIPAVIAFQRSQPIDGFMGALPESEVRNFIDRIAGPLAGDGRAAEAEALAAAGAAADAAELFAEILADDPADLGAIAGLARIYLDMGEPPQARALLDSAPASAEKHAGVAAARAALDLAEQAGALGAAQSDFAALLRRVEADPNDHQARFDYAVLLNAAGRREDAATALLEIIRRDRSFNEDGARKQLLQFFEAWGPADPGTIFARKKLSTVLFS